MAVEILLLCVIFVPLAGSAFLPLLSRINTRLRNALAFLFVLTSLGLLLVLLPMSLTDSPPSFHVALPLGLSFGFLADGLAVFMAIVSSFLGLLIVVYSFGYIAHSENQGEYYFMVVLFIGAMMGITLTTDLVFLYVFWEISAVCCWRLIGFFRKNENTRRANKAFLITGIGALIMLCGFMLIYAQYGTTDLTLLRGKDISSLAVTLILFGILSKSATLPLHSWIADAGVAPTPATSLLHAAVLVKIGVYAYTRLFVVNFHIETFFHTAIPVIAAISAILSAGAAIRENDLKRIIAYSTVSQLGFIFLGLSIGGEMALYGGVMYILMHAISKAGLFLCAGIVEHGCHTKDLRQLGGLYKAMPWTAASFLLCAFSVMGIPPFGGFFSKYFVISGTVAKGQVAMAAVFIIGAVMTLVYLLRAFYLVFLGDYRGEHAPGHEGTGGMVGTVVFLAALSLLSGLFVNPFATWIGAVTMQIGGLL